MKLDDMGLAFPQQCLPAALLVSLFSAWVLAVVFYSLNRCARRDYFSIWTGAWLFYAVWLTLSLGLGNATPGSALFTVNRLCISMSAVFLMWGSARYLGLTVPRRLSSVFAIFMAVWILAGPRFMKDALLIHLPVFILLGLSASFAGVCLFRLRMQNVFVSLGMLSLGFLLGAFYIGTCSFSRHGGKFFTACFFDAAALQVVVTMGMIIVLFQKARSDAKAVKAEIEAVRQEKFKLITTKEACQNLYERMRAADETERAVAKMRLRQQAAAEREQLDTLGQMAGDLAHDLNNALTPITAYSELLLNTLPNLPDLSRQRLQRISHAAENVAQIIAHLREFHRPGTEPAPANPAIAPGTEARLDPDLPVVGGPCRPLRILCIDDDLQLRQVMHDVLQMDHHHVTVAPGGREGLDLFRSHLRAGDPYEVVITDLGMPDFDGRHVARAIKAESPQTPVIMLTGWGTMMNNDGQPAPDVDAVISKPPRAQELNNLLLQITTRSERA